ncbi:MAG: hypothetical protein WBG42_12900 [Cryomorphaceae bacterium]
MEETTLLTIENIESIVTISAILIGGIWAYFRFRKTREDHPKVQIELNLTLLGIEGDRCLLECEATLENKGLVRHSFKEFTFDLLHFSSTSEYKRGDERVNHQVVFEKEAVNRKVSWIPGDWNYSFVDPGIKQRYTYLADVPANSKYVLIHSQFKYKDQDSDFHSIQRAFSLEELRETKKETTDD